MSPQGWKEWAWGAESDVPGVHSSRCGPEAVVGRAFQSSHLGVLTSHQGIGQGATAPLRVLLEFANFWAITPWSVSATNCLTTGREGGGGQGYLTIAYLMFGALAPAHCGAQGPGN